MAVLDKANNWTVKLSGGVYTLDLQGGRDVFKLKDNKLTVSRFGQTVVQIDYTPTKALVQANPRNATSTAGWHGWPADAPPPAIAPFNAEAGQSSSGSLGEVPRCAGGVHQHHRHEVPPDPAGRVFDGEYGGGD